MNTRISDGEISPVEVTRNALDRLEMFGSALGATTSILADEALASARRAEREIGGGDYRGPLHGVPLGIKDLADVEGAALKSKYGGYKQLWKDWDQESEPETVVYPIKEEDDLRFLIDYLKMGDHPFESFIVDS